MVGKLTFWDEPADFVTAKVVSGDTLTQAALQGEETNLRFGITREEDKSPGTHRIVAAFREAEDAKAFVEADQARKLLADAVVVLRITCSGDKEYLNPWSWGWGAHRNSILSRATKLGIEHVQAPKAQFGVEMDRDLVERLSKWLEAGGMLIDEVPRSPLRQSDRMLLASKLKFALGVDA